MLAALAPQVPRVGLGQLVTCSSFRPAGLLAKQAACLDVISGGRLLLGLGAGWYEREAASYGIPFRGGPGAPAGAGGDAVGRPDAVDGRGDDVRGTPRPPRRRALRSQAPAAAAADLGGRRRRAGDAADRGPVGRRDQLAGGAGELRAQVAVARPVLLGRRAGPGVDRPDARPRRVPVRHRGGHATLAGLAGGRPPAQADPPGRVGPGQLRGDGRHGRREGAGVRGRRLRGVRELVPRLPVVGLDGGLDERRGPAAVDAVGVGRGRRRSAVRRERRPDRRGRPPLPLRARRPPAALGDGVRGGSRRRRPPGTRRSS